MDTPASTTASYIGRQPRARLTRVPAKRGPLGIPIYRPWRNASCPQAWLHGPRPANVAHLIFVRFFLILIS
jgi:hypothetical protein